MDLFCIASKKPIGSKEGYSELYTYRGDLDKLFKKNSNHIRAAEIIQRIATLLTIPITSAICSIATVAFMQEGRLRTKLTLRQTAALADQGWLSPRILARSSAYGSLLLYVAFGLTLLGSVSQILQGSIVTKEPVRVRTESYSFGPNNVAILDVPVVMDEAPGDSERLIRLRSLLETSSVEDPEPYLWAEHGAPMLGYNTYHKALETIANERHWSIMGIQPGFYFAPLVANFSTGVSTLQHALRINTTIEYVNITKGELPAECNGDLEGGFVVDYHIYSERYDGDMDLTACIPKYVRKLPWKATYDRQDITEVLYLHIRSNIQDYTVPADQDDIIKITAKTSLGYFELPGVHNGYRAGPLLDALPVEPDTDGWDQLFRRRNIKRAANNTDSYTGNATLLETPNHGPLTMLALALFAEGSYIDTHLSQAAAQVVNLPQFVSDDDMREWGTVACVGLFPLTGLWEQSSIRSSIPQCLHNYDMLDEDRVIGNVVSWILLFTQGDLYSRQPLERAAFLANKDWLTPRYTSHYGREVRFDEGRETVIPTVSLVWVIVGSVLVGAHLFGLLVLALYVFKTKLWIPSLGAEAIVRMGTTCSDVLGAADGDGEWAQTAAACPGFIGDERPGGIETIGRLAFGAPAGLSTDRRYESLS